MKDKNLLPFISDDDLYNHVARVLDVAKTAVDTAEENLYSNVVDPFSAVFDAMRQGVGLTEWLEQEKSRQLQKTLQNALGDFHQEVIGSMNNWESLGDGHVVDVRNNKLKVIAEIKNKWNTTKGTDQKSIYDNLKTQLKKEEYDGFKAYYVEIIPKSKGSYDKLFTPSDNVTHTKRPKNKNIRRIDGKSFYALASGDSDAIDKLYLVLPGVIGDVLGISAQKIEKDSLFKEIFGRAY